MAQMHTLDAFLLALQVPVADPWLPAILDTAADDTDLADEDEDEDEDDEDEEDDDEVGEDEEDDEGENDDEDVDDDEDPLDEGDDEPAEARTARGQLKRQNGHRRPREGHTSR